MLGLMLCSAPLAMAQHEVDAEGFMTLGSKKGRHGLPHGWTFLSLGDINEIELRVIDITNGRVKDKWAELSNSRVKGKESSNSINEEKR